MSWMGTSPDPTQGGNTDSLKKLLQLFMGGSSRGPLPGWTTRQPLNTTELQRQLSANAGQMPMPNGMVGAVQQPSFGSPAQATQGIDPRTYGRKPGMGEATFFQQSTRGGMTPVSAISPLGVPLTWNPFAAYQRRTKADRQDDKKGGGKDLPRPITDQYGN